MRRAAEVYFSEKDGIVRVEMTILNRIKKVLGLPRKGKIISREQLLGMLIVEKVWHS